MTKINIDLQYSCMAFIILFDARLKKDACATLSSSSEPLIVFTLIKPRLPFIVLKDSSRGRCGLPGSIGWSCKFSSPVVRTEKDPVSLGILC